MHTINLAQKAALINETWHPYIIGALNDNYIKLARLKGEFVWHKHDEEDELFVVVQGRLIMDFEDHTAEAGPGEILVVPKGVLHRPRTGDEEVVCMLVEPKETKHTGNEITAITVTSLEWI